MLMRRSPIEITGEVLRLGPATKTEIMYSVNLSHDQVQSYLASMMRLGLIQKEAKARRFVRYAPTSHAEQLGKHIDAVMAALGLDKAAWSGLPE